MKKYFLIAMMAIMTMGVYAQHEVGSLTIQPKIGTNGSILFLDDKNVSYESFHGFNGGVELEYRIKKWFSLSAGVQYSTEGGKTKIKDVKAIEKANLDYINIPVLANFYVWKGLALKIGVQPAFKVNEKIEHADNVILSHSKYAFGDKAENFEVRMPLGISYDFGRVALEMRIAPSLTKAFDGKDYYNSTAQLNIGYKFSLK